MLFFLKLGKQNSHLGQYFPICVIGEKSYVHPDYGKLNC